MQSESNEHLTLAAFIASIFFDGMNAMGVRFSVKELAPFWGAAAGRGGGETESTLIGATTVP